MPQYVIRLSVRPLICPSVCEVGLYRYVFHTGQTWNSKIISRLNSLILVSARAGPNIGDLVQHTDKIWVELGWRHEHTKNCNISETVKDRYKVTIMTDYRKSHTRFRLVPKSMTMDDGRNTLADKIV